jgi:hypothetical protein
VSRTLEEMDREFPERTTDPRDYALLYQQRIVLQTVETALEEDGLEEMARVYELLKLGDSWFEISTKLGQGEDAVKRRFYRFRKKFRSNN